MTTDEALRIVAAECAHWPAECDRTSVQQAAVALAAEVHRQREVIRDRESLLDAASAVVAAFEELGRSTNLATQAHRHQRCEAAMLALDAALRLNNAVQPRRAR